MSLTIIKYFFIFHQLLLPVINSNNPGLAEAMMNNDELRQNRAELIQKFINSSVDPCEDFYEYACGNWKSIHQIPSEKSTYSILDILQDDVVMVLRNILSEPISDKNNESEIKAKTYFKSCLNEDGLKKFGIKPLLNALDEYGRFPASEGQSFSDWLNLTLPLALLGEKTLLSISVGDDLENSNHNIIFITEGDLVLANRDDYLSDAEANVNHLNAYKKTAQSVMELLGIDHDIVLTVVNEIINFETELAKIMFDSKQRFDLIALFRRYTVKDLNEMHPEIDWVYMISKLLNKPISLSREIALFGREDYIGNLIELTSATEPRIIVNFILWKWISHTLERFDGRFDNVLQEFIKSLTGQQVKIPKWKRCVQETNKKFQWAVGALFIKNKFDEQSRKDITQMTKQLQQTFREILENLDWIDEATKLIAYDKLDAMLLDVGYPDFILSENDLNKKYENVFMDSEKYFENYLTINTHMNTENLNKLDEIIDRSEWRLPPVSVNAQLELTNNRILIYSGILQEPIYHTLYPRALNYGSIGFIIGHELTHGFDDQGYNFNKNGDLKPWWTSSSIENFQKKTDCFVEQYSNFSWGEKYLNSNASLNEDIADNGGIREAFITYKKWLETTNDFEALERETLPGLNFTSTQLFFLSFAQTWCANARPEAIEHLIETDFHSPEKFRVIGPLSNFEAFSEEFNCPLGSPMNPLNKCKLWG